MQPSIGAQLNRASSPIRQRLRSGKRYVVDLHWDSLNNLSDCTVEELTRYIEELGNPLRSDSFSSIATVSAREDFETAIDNIKQGIFLFGNSRGKNFKTTTSRAVMDSPSDLSPNAPPSGFDESNNYFSNLQAPPAPPSSSSTGQASTEGSVDSSGFEKVDHDVLEEYGQQFVNQMQQSLFGKPLEADSSKQDMSSGPRDDVLEKSYGGDLIDIPKNETYPDQAKLTAGDHPTEDTKQASNTMHSFDLLGDVVPEVHDTKSVPTERSHGTGTHDHFHHDDAPFEPVGRGGVPLDQLIEDQVAEVHGDVDEVLHRMQETDEFKHNVEKKEEHVEKKEERHIPEDSDSDHPDFRSQTPEVEESTFNRRGPLTIPEVPEKVPGDDLLEDDHQHDRFGFEKEPRPPTPPKDISEESVKPSAFSLAHGTGSSPSHPDVLHPILKHGGSQSAEPWFDFKTIDPRLLELIYWRDPKKSAVALSLILLAVFILAKYPILSVIAYTGLAILAGTLGFRVFKTIEAQVKKTNGENPFQEYLAKDLTLPQERIHAQVDVLTEHGTLLANQVKRLVFVENIVDSAKFALILWALTYIAHWFSGFTLIVLGILAVFSVPKVYEMYQEPIDAQLAVISDHIKNATKMAEEKLPFLKKVQAEVEKKEQ